ncbi:C6 zinc finger domain-containing protein [Plectosphaerella cucumerina]|uniref:C6 zinc finger domain-containing protein n=1 Tax=Plectosphaerella cucumerina TaxID=40658 RepID=A0A8K0WXJ8_9PEZI|nr:C6 zinc finger domain-containing protein [Plectosphaerella cucumerina]
MAKTTRRSTPRVKTGCRTCRVRRVKCDEAKPSCLKCTQTGRKCDGYAPPTRAGQSPNSARSSPGLLELTAYSIPFRMPGSQRDRQLLHYFCVRGSAELSGFVNNDFWSRTALLASQNETIVRQSLIALSSLHLDLSRAPGSGPGTDVVGSETLAQYGKALRSLQTRINRPDETPEARFETSKAALICCALFHCFESAMGESEAAMRHLSNGLHLLAEHDKHQTIEDEHMPSLRDLFGRLDLQATFYDDGRTPALDMVSHVERNTGLFACPMGTFFTLCEAQKHLNRLQNWLLHLITDNLQYHNRPAHCVPQSALAEKAQLVTEFEHWARRYDNFISGSSEFGLSGTVRGGRDRAVRTLWVHHAMSEMLLASKIPDDPEVFGTVPNQRALLLVRQCESILLPQTGADSTASPSSPSSGTSTSVPSRSLSSETGVIVALFLLAMKCADEQVIEEATDLLVASQRREGLYDAVTMATLVQQLKRVRNRRKQGLEEVGLGFGGEIPLEDWVEDLIEKNPGGAGDLASLVGELPVRCLGERT